MLRASSPPEPAREQERAVPALSEEKCRSGAASPALAIEDVLFPFVQHAESVANFRQGNIDGTRKLVILIFRRVTHIDPLGSIGDFVARLLCRYAVQQGFRRSSAKSFRDSRRSTPSVFIVTVALRLASDTSASSPNASPLFSSASSIETPPTIRSTLHRPVSITK